jgi:hypothetical protein
MRRVWIIREVLVAREVQVIWGNEKFPWTLIAGVMSFLISTGWHYYIDTTHFRALPMVVYGAGVYATMLQRQDMASTLGWNTCAERG